MIYTLGNLKPSYLGDNHWIADSADLIGNIQVGLEVSIWWRAVIRGDNEPIKIGNRTNIQDGCVLHTDPGFPILLGCSVTIGHMCMLHGCEIGDGSLIGIGSVVLNGVKIGKNCLIGANSLITEGTVIHDNSLVIGSPGKVKRELNPEQAMSLAKNADGYVERAKEYTQSLAKL